MSRSTDFVTGQGEHTGPRLREGSYRKDRGEDVAIIDNVAESHKDRDLADLAGYSERNYGYHVERWPDDRAATVHLWNS